MKVFFVLTAALIGLAAAPARADSEYCNDYWFVRNQAFDHAGYCFSTPLGQAIFNNADCHTSNPVLAPRDSAMVERVRGIESRLGCKVDTSRTSLPIPLLGLRLQLTDLAARDEHSGAGCFGWNGPGFMLWSGFREGGVPLSEVRAGDDLIFLYETWDAPQGWGYLEVQRDGVPVGLGWTNAPINWDLCTQVAG